MFKFIRTKILPLFLARQITTFELAKAANVSYKTTLRAVCGFKVSAASISKIGKALGLTDAELVNYLEV